MNSILPSGDAAGWTLSNVTALMGNILSLALLLASAVAVIFIIIGAYNYLLAFGSEEKAAAGKKTLTWAIVGLVVILLSRFIVTQVWNMVAAQPLNLPI